MAYPARLVKRRLMNVGCESQQQINRLVLDHAEMMLVTAPQPRRAIALACIGRTINNHPDNTRLRSFCVHVPISLRPAFNAGETHARSRSESEMRCRINAVMTRLKRTLARLRKTLE